MTPVPSDGRDSHSVWIDPVYHEHASLAQAFCECGWESKVQDDGEARNAGAQHLRQVIIDAWPFGGRPEDGALPAPAPEIIMAANGVYWRRYAGTPATNGIHLSMVPASADNDPVLTPIAIYHLVGWEDHDGTFTEAPDA